MSITFHSIGTIHTPYFSYNAPHQPLPDAPGDFWITLDSEYADALKSLADFNYIYVLYHLDQVTPPLELLTHSPWAPELEIGLFASRSPKRPNPIGLSIVQLKEIQGNELIISGIDAYNGTPLLDIKPYMHFRDSIEDANNGWFETLPDKEHTIAHALGRAHEHEHADHEHEHEHTHTHTHEHEHLHAHDNDHGHHEHSSHENSHDKHYHTLKHTHGHDHHDHSHLKPLHEHND